MRLFFALPVPAEAKERLRPSLDAARKTGGEGVSFTRPEQLHFTLAFLGDQSDHLTGQRLTVLGLYAVLILGASWWTFLRLRSQLGDPPAAEGDRKQPG